VFHVGDVVEVVPHVVLLFDMYVEPLLLRVLVVVFTIESADEAYVHHVFLLRLGFLTQECERVDNGTSDDLSDEDDDEEDVGEIEKNFPLECIVECLSGVPAIGLESVVEDEQVAIK
jgi:hypothetical protein